MKNPELFNETISILVKAYFDGTLRHNDCAACAVGNMVAARNNCVLELDDFICAYDKSGNEFDNRLWFDLVHGLGFSGDSLKSAQDQIQTTGYTLQEITDIELAFDYLGWNEENDTDGFKGLMNVVDTLQKIHECTDEEREEAKLKFVRA